MRSALVAVVLVMVTGVAIAAEAPRAKERDGWIEITLSGALLDDTRVRQRAESGLTATLVILDRSSRGSSPGVARIAFRYDPWDEIFVASVIHADGERTVTRVDSLAALRAHIAAASIRLVRRSAMAAREIVVEVMLVPFSSEEELDAREWFLDSIGATPKGSGSGGIGSVDGIADVLLATSIKARPVARWTWKVVVSTSRGNDP